MARSELVLLALACGGCDVVFDVGEPRACSAASFDGATGEAIVPTDDFSISWDESYAVLGIGGLPYEYRFDGTPTQIDLGPYSHSALALAPEADGLFWTAQGDPPLLMAAGTHDGTTWSMGARVPKGTFAGTPSADGFGTRHALVRLRANEPAVQEYVDDSGVWQPTGATHDVPGDTAPNLTPNGLTMVWADTDGIHLATRASRDAWFGTDTLVLAGAHREPQLLGKCGTLYTLDAGMLTRYRR